MKTKNVLFLFALLFSVSIFAQDAKTKIAVSYLDVKGLTLDPSQAGNLARKELAKTEDQNISLQTLKEIAKSNSIFINRYRR